MEISFTPAQMEWREEIREFLDKELPPEWEKSTEFCEDEDFWDFALAFTRKVSAKGWIGLTWPEQYGGLNRPPVDHLIFSEEFVSRDAPLVNMVGWSIVSVALFNGGTEEQKMRFLPPIARTDYLWAEGYSEPGAGSDLASLTTRAVRDGDEWVISGQKTFTSWGSHAQYFYVAARTDPDAPRHQGITMFAVEMSKPGVKVAPLFNLGGGRQNHTYLDKVRVGDDMVIGHVNHGWDIIMGGLFGSNVGAFVLTPYMDAQRRLGKIIEFCKQTKRNGRRLIDDTTVKDHLVEMDLMLQAERLLAYESLSNLQSGRPPAYAGAISSLVPKLYWPRFAELTNIIVGRLSQIRAGSAWSPIGDDANGGPEGWYRHSFRNHEGGTPEVKRMVLATRGLGLPR
jgi:alkylation response protein AidB-like acyl-CoA dehydrogenase